MRSPESIWSFSAETRTWKNSSRFCEKIARNFARSSSGQRVVFREREDAGVEVEPRQLAVEVASVGVDGITNDRVSEAHGRSSYVRYVRCTLGRPPGTRGSRDGRPPLVEGRAGRGSRRPGVPGGWVRAPAEGVPGSSRCDVDGNDAEMTSGCRRRNRPVAKPRTASCRRGRWDCSVPDHSAPIPWADGRAHEDREHRVAVLEARARPRDRCERRHLRDGRARRLHLLQRRPRARRDPRSCCTCSSRWRRSPSWRPCSARSSTAAAVVAVCSSWRRARAGRCSASSWPRTSRASRCTRSRSAPSCSRRVRASPKSALVPAVVDDESELVRGQLAVAAHLGARGHGGGVDRRRLPEDGRRPVGAARRRVRVHCARPSPSFRIPRAQTVGAGRDHRGAPRAAPRRASCAAGTAMGLLRGAVGFMTFFVALLLKKQHGEPRGSTGSSSR